MISNRLLGWEMICAHNQRQSLNGRCATAELCGCVMGALPCSRWTPQGGGPARRHRWSSCHPNLGRLWPNQSRHCAPPCPTIKNGREETLDQSAVLCVTTNLRRAWHYLSEDDVKGENLKEEVWGDGQNLLLFFVLLHDVAVGGVVKVQPANTQIRFYLTTGQNLQHWPTQIYDWESSQLFLWGFISFHLFFVKNYWTSSVFE